MNYIINVSKKQAKPSWDGLPAYSHLFATAEHSLTTEAQARELLSVFVEKFPAPEYQLTLTRWEKQGEVLAFINQPSDVKA